MGVSRVALRFVLLIGFSICLYVPGAAAAPNAGGAACGAGFQAVPLCGGQEALCVPEGCSFGCVSCCPPCQGEGCPDQGGPECQGGSCTCESGCADQCFTVSLAESTMAPVLGRGPLVLLLAALFVGGLILLRFRATRHT